MVVAITSSLSTARVATGLQREEYAKSSDHADPLVKGRTPHVTVEHMRDDGLMNSGATHSAKPDVIH